MFRNNQESELNLEKMGDVFKIRGSSPWIFLAIKDIKYFIDLK